MLGMAKAQATWRLDHTTESMPGCGDAPLTCDADLVQRGPQVQTPPIELPSKSQLKKAGDRIRHRATGTLELDGEQAAADAQLVKGWRSAHSGALLKTRVGLGTVISREWQRSTPAGLVTQRLKRYESIVAKLVRARTRLGEMEDIAGCRAILPSLPAAERVHAQLAGARKLDVVQVKDYNSSPHQGGYHALHLWCTRDNFKVEVQLRTPRQQEWAELVEEWDSVLGLDLKHEIGPDVVLEYFRELADYYFRLDSGVAHSDIDTAPLTAAHLALRTWLKGGSDHE